MHRVCLIVFTGLPASGKTSFTTQFSGWLSERNEEIQSTYCQSHDPTDSFHQREALGLSVRYDDIMPREIEETLINPKYQFICCQAWKEKTPVDVTKNEWSEYRRHIVTYVEEAIGKILDIPVEKSNIPSERIHLFDKHIKSQVDHIIDHERRCDVALLVDDNMYYKSMRYQYYQLARKYKLGYVQVYIDCPCELALERNKSRTNKVPHSIIEDMQKKMEPPDPKNYFWEENTLRVISPYSSSSFVNLFGAVLTALQSPAKERFPVKDESDESRIECSKNEIHQTDQILRSVISQRMAALKDSSRDQDVLRSNARAFNTTKNVILSDLKKCTFYVPKTLREHVNDSSKSSFNPYYKYIEEIYDEYCFSGNYGENKH